MAIKVSEIARDNMLRVIIVADEIYYTTLLFDELVKRYFGDDKKRINGLLKQADYISKQYKNYVQRLELYHADDVYMATAIMNAKEKGKRQLEALYNKGVSIFKTTKHAELFGQVCVAGYLSVALMDFIGGIAKSYRAKGYRDECDIFRGLLDNSLPKLIVNFANNLMFGVELNLTQRDWDDMATRCVKFLNSILLPENFDKIKTKSEKEAEALR